MMTDKPISRFIARREGDTDCQTWKENIDEKSTYKEAPEGAEEGF